MVRLSRSAFSSFINNNPSVQESERRLLFRDFIQKSLYDPIHGYFSQSKPPVLQHVKRPRFRDIASRAEYQKTVADTYSAIRHGWMTPIELFSPYLSRAISNRLRSVARENEPINIIEIGAGRGTLAADILTHWARVAPEFLRNVKYSVVEVSPVLAEMQSKVLRPWLDSGNVTIFRSDARTWFKSLREDLELGENYRDSYCHIIGTEVLDNVPHDLVRVRDGAVEQAVVVESGDLQPSDHYRKSRSVEWTSDVDQVTAESIRAFKLLENPSSSYISRAGASLLNSFRHSFEEILGGGKREIWVPSGSYQLMEAIAAAVPHGSLTISDFDYFPGALPGENGPVVQSLEQGTAVVYDSVEAAPFGQVDIMFPTDFNALADCHQMLCEEQIHRVSHLYQITSQQQFFQDNAHEDDIADSTCQDGYNPILQDFENASFLIADNTSGH